MTENMTVIGSIRHNDRDRTDRVTLYRVEGSEYVWACASDEDPYETDVPLGNEATAWSGPEWDLQMADE